MQKDVETNIEYRLPITYVRVAGGVDETHDKTDDSVSRAYSLAITAETGADLASLQKIPLALGGKSDVTFNLTADGRLTGTVMKRIADDRSAIWKAAASAAGTVVGIAGPALLAAGPPGWAALAGAAVVAGGAAVAYTGGRGILEFEATRRDEGGQHHHETPTVNPSDVGVPTLYVDECPAEATVLAQYRVAKKRGSEQHAAAVFAMLSDADPDLDTTEVRLLESLLRSIDVGLAKAEHAFAIWHQEQLTVTTTTFDERLRVDHLPTESELMTWCAAPQPRQGGWRELAIGAHTVASLDLIDDPVRGEPRVARGTVDVFSTMDVMYRPPRPAILRVWRITGKGSTYHAEKIETRRLEVTYPGNEKELSLRSQNTETLDLGFDDDGALTKVVVSSTSPVIRRAELLDSSLTAAGAAIAAGKDIREAISPASLVDQLAERKAAGELGLLPSPEDPLKKLRDQLEEARLRAQLRIAEQINSSSIVPVVVQFSD